MTASVPAQLAVALLAPEGIDAPKRFAVEKMRGKAPHKEVSRTLRIFVAFGIRVERCADGTRHELIYTSDTISISTVGASLRWT